MCTPRMYAPVYISVIRETHTRAGYVAVSCQHSIPLISIGIARWAKAGQLDPVK